MKRSEIVVIGNAASQMKKWKDEKADKILSWEFSPWILSLWRAVKDVYEDAIEYETAMQERKTELALLHCKKDKDGKPVMLNHVDEKGNVVAQEYSGLGRGMVPEFDTEFKKWGDEKKSYFAEDVAVDFARVKKLKAEKVPHSHPNYSPEIIEPLLDWIEGI